MRVFRVPSAALIAAILLALVVAPSAQARSARCFGGSTGPMCTVWSGKVTDVNDGDTIDVRFGGRRREIRLRAIQAMEMTKYNKRARRGPCHSVDATVALERTLRRAGNRVRVSTRTVDGRDNLGRLRRYIAVRRGGRWRDVGELLLEQGHVLWMDSTADTTWNERYNLAQQRAAQRGRNLWDPVECGRGPQQDLPIDVWVNWDAFGSDAENVNGEWIKIRNRGGRALELGGWWVRDAMLRRFTFPRGTSVAPGATTTVYIGRGSNRPPSVFHWNQRQPVFENANGDGRHLGDGAYLFDPRGDLRAHMLYPCVVACTDPRRGAIEVEARPRRPESITVRNVSARTIDLYGTQLALTRGSAYDFGPDSALGPGEEIVVEVEGDPGDDTRLRRHWGVDGYMLADRGDAMRLRTYSGIVIACDAWGDADCS
jgi:micrococcal nuclease